ncbi:vegetative cell wall protein gp1-like [Ipomoea triloba]|uniref:vegetative cell wall protein gp1-like n=1 Tax=Ipomoea triloba TaxID=35885 RepID=UPI00125D8473|nr:vegetative cell wall protein gp1-like [Ipomoea triloba]
MKLPKLTSFFLIFIFVSSFLTQARRLQENYDEDELKKATYKPLISSATYNGKLPAATGDFLLTLRLEVPTSQDSQSFFERFNGVVAYTLTLTSLSSGELGREAKSPPPSPKPSDPKNPTIIPSSLSSEEFGRGAKSPPPSPKPSDPINPTINPYSLSSEELGREPKSPPPPPKPSDPKNPTIISSGQSSAGEFGREEKSPPPAPKTDTPDHPKITTSSSYGRTARPPPPAPKPAAPIHPGNSGVQVISMADDSSDFLASA